MHHGPAKFSRLDLGGDFPTVPVQREGLLPPDVEVEAQVLLQAETWRASQEPRGSQAARRGRVPGDGDHFLKADAGQWARPGESTALFRSGVN